MAYAPRDWNTITSWMMIKKTVSRKTEVGWLALQQQSLENMINWTIR